MSGLETLQHIRAANPKQLVIFMTAYGTAQTAIEAMKFGASAFLEKPVTLQKLLRAVEEQLVRNASQDITIRTRMEAASE